MVIHCASLLAQLRESGVALAVVSSPEISATASEALMFNLFSSFAEFEAELIRDRLRDARAALKSRGQRVAGVVPYGYTADPFTKQLMPEGSEARRIQAIFERAARGQTPRQIATHANRHGWRTKRTTSRKTGKVRGANHWTPRQVLATLTNPVYVGLVRVGKGTRPGAHAPLVSRDLFDRVAAQIAARRGKSKGRRDRNAIPWPLRGLLFCGKCSRLTSPSISGYGVRRYRYYRCRSHARGRPPCVGVSAPAEEIERFVCELLAAPSTDGPLLASDDANTQSTIARVRTTLPERTRRRLLPQVIGQTVLDVGKQTIKVTLAPGALQAVVSLKDLV